MTPGDQEAGGVGQKGNPWLMPLISRYPTYPVAFVNQPSDTVRNPAT